MLSGHCCTIPCHCLLLPLYCIIFIHRVVGVCAQWTLLYHSLSLLTFTIILYYIYTQSSWGMCSMAIVVPFLVIAYFYHYIVLYFTQSSWDLRSVAIVVPFLVIAYFYCYWYMQQTQVSVYRTIGPLVIFVGYISPWFHECCITE